MAISVKQTSTSFSVSKAASFAYSFTKDRELLKYSFAFYSFFLIVAGVLLTGWLATVGDGLLQKGWSFSRLLDSATGFVAAGFVLLLVFILASTWFKAFILSAAGGAVRKSKFDFQENAKNASTRFAPLVRVTLLIAIASLFLNAVTLAFESLKAPEILVSIVDSIITVFITLAFLYAPFLAVATGRNAVDSLKESVRLFTAQPLKTVLLILVQLVYALVVGIALLFIGLVFAALIYLLYKSIGLSIIFAAVGFTLSVIFFSLACIAAAMLNLFSSGIIAFASSTSAFKKSRNH